MDEALAQRSEAVTRAGAVATREAAVASFGVGAIAFAVFAAWAAKDGGYAVTTWYPGALFLVGLLAIVALADARALVRVPRAAAVAAVFLVAFAAWSAASIAWSSDKGVAWDGANRTVLYAAVYVLFLLLRGRVGGALWLLGFAAAVAAIGVVDVARAAAAADPSSFFLGGRLAAPAGYPNAACALFVLAAWPPAYAAARRELPAVARGGAFALACVLAELAAMTQSRASLVVIPVAALVYLALVPFRVRALLPLVGVGAALALTVDRLLAAYVPLTHGRDAGPALRTAVWTFAFTFAVAFAVWSLVALVDRRVVVPWRVARAANVALAVLLVAAVASAGVALAAGSPRARVAHAWREFKSGYPDPTRSSTHFSSGLGNNRYDFWRVALDEFRRHPLAGVGADNFAEDYVADRRSHEEPLYPHSLELRVLAQTGLVGVVLFVGFVASAAFAARGLFRRTGPVDGLLRAGVAGASYVGIHGSIDWFWEFPALTAPAVAALAIAAGSGSSTRRAERLRRRDGAVVAAMLVAAALAASSFVFPWFAARLEHRAAAGWRADGAAAYRDLSRARRLNPLSPDPDLLAGAIASRRGDVPRMRDAFGDALRRDPRQWYAHLELAVAEAALGRREVALRNLADARRLDPREPVVRFAERRLRERRAIDRAAIDHVFLERYRRRAGL